jgi:GH15 family glucan-1,4-alpha-glucosidase
MECDFGFPNTIAVFIIVLGGTLARDDRPVKESMDRDLDLYPPIGDYALIGDMHTAALVSSAGSIDWACFPRFDSDAVFGRLLDWQLGGHFSLAPHDVWKTTRRYLPNTNVLETTFVTENGRATMVDFMPVLAVTGPNHPRDLTSRRQIVRRLECVSGNIDFELTCMPRFDYGGIVPHASLLSPHLGLAHGGKDAISIFSTAPMEEDNDGFVAHGRLSAGESLCTSITYEAGQPHYIEPLDEGELNGRLGETIKFWEDWASVCTYEGAYHDDVLRSALTLKALTYAPSGALIAAPTTSLPEVIGGVRNWDYRFTWLRDSTFALYALFILGYKEEALEFKRWMEWSTMGRARDLQVMYGLTGERRLVEISLPQLEGYKMSRPVRIGNAAHSQFQLDIYGEILDSAHLFRRFGGEMDTEYWGYLRRVVEFILDHWREPDDGIWEARSERRQYTFSKVACWMGLDRAIKAATTLGLDGEVTKWKASREEIRAEILEKGYDADRGSFVQSYGSDLLDASALLFPLLGFMPTRDPRMTSTIRAIERELTTPDGLVYRYRGMDDGLGGREGTFLVCSFWLADNLTFLGEREKATALFEKLLTYSNDLGLYSEQLDPLTHQQLGNFPQAFTHIGLINAAVQLSASPRRPSYHDEHPPK